MGSADNTARSAIAVALGYTLMIAAVVASTLERCEQAYGGGDA